MGALKNLDGEPDYWCDSESSEWEIEEIDTGSYEVNNWLESSEKMGDMFQEIVREVLETELTDRGEILQ